MTRSLLSRRRRGGRSMLRSHLIDACEALLCRFASRASIRWLRDVDRPPRRSLSNELLIARGTPPNLEIDPETPVSGRKAMGARKLVYGNATLASKPNRP